MRDNPALSIGIACLSLERNSKSDPSQTGTNEASTNKPSETDLSLVDGDPVGGGEPLVVLDVVDAVLEVAVALGEVHLQQVLQQVLQVRAEVRREANLQWTGEAVKHLGWVKFSSSVLCNGAGVS